MIYCFFDRSDAQHSAQCLRRHPHSSRVISWIVLCCHVSQQQQWAYCTKILWKYSEYRLHLWQQNIQHCILMMVAGNLLLRWRNFKEKPVPDPRNSSVALWPSTNKVNSVRKKVGGMCRFLKCLIEWDYSLLVLFWLWGGLHYSGFRHKQV